MGSRSPMRRGNFGEMVAHPIVKYRDFLPWVVGNGWTDRFAAWVVDSGGLKEAQVQSYSQGGANVHNFSRIRQVAPMYSMTLWRELCKNGWTDRLTVRVVDSGGPKEAQCQLYSAGGAHVPTWEGTLAPPGNTTAPSICGGDAFLFSFSLYIN